MTFERRLCVYKTERTAGSTYVGDDGKGQQLRLDWLQYEFYSMWGALKLSQNQIPQQNNRSGQNLGWRQGEEEVARPVTWAQPEEPFVCNTQP